MLGMPGGGTNPGGGNMLGIPGGGRGGPPGILKGIGGGGTPIGILPTIPGIIACGAGPPTPRTGPANPVNFLKMSL